MFAFSLPPSKRLLIQQSQDFRTTETGANAGREGVWDVPPFQAESALILQPPLTSLLLQP